MCLLYGPILLATVFLHEVAHVLATKALGNSPTAILLWPAGGLRHQPSQNVAQDWKIAMAGPCANLLQALVWTGVYAAITRATFDSTFTAGVIQEELSTVSGFLANLTAQAVWINIFVMLFNMVELGYPLDGAQILAGILTRYCSLRTVALTSDIASLIVGLFLLVWSVYDVGFDDNNGIGILGFFVIGYVVVSSVYHVTMTRTGNIAMHPLVARTCYREVEDDVGERDKQEGGEVEVA